MAFERDVASSQGSVFWMNYARYVSDSLRFSKSWDYPSLVGIACSCAVLCATGHSQSLPLPRVERLLSHECAIASALLDPGPNATTLGPLIDLHHLRGPTDLVLEAMTRYCALSPGGQIVAPMRRAIDHPFALADHVAHATKPFTKFGTSLQFGERRSPSRAAAEFVCTSFGAGTEDLAKFQGRLPITNAQGAIFAMDFLLNEPRLKFAGSIADRPSSDECFEFLSMLITHVSPDAQIAENFSGFATRARRSMDMSDSGMMRAIAMSLAHIDADFGITADWKSAPPEPPPTEIADAVNGPTLAAENVTGVGWVVVGSLGANSYDMRRIAAVFDPGGDDSYTWSGVRTGNQAIVDLAGNDQYIGGELQGPAAALFGICLIDDAAGDDDYSGKSFSCGAGMFGVGILIDRAGNDRYRTGTWSLGAGILGAGFVFDESGSDEYQSAAYSQGIGGPLGIGAIIDTKGNDLYRSDGALPGVDGVPAVAFAMSQGIGFGARRLIAGGVGLLADFSGDDRYECGEFGQGGGYYFGFGMLVDTSGNDLFRGSHYAQGFTAHQAAGALIDLDGNDTYWSLISAGQGAAWDTSVSLLLDAHGNDTYRGGALSQGSAAEQSIAMLCDLDGSDHYLGLGPFVQGESGDNAYHFADTKARSFSVLIDDGIGEDFFSSMRTIGGVTVTGPAETTGAPASAPLFGLMIDLRSRQSLFPVR